MKIAVSVESVHDLSQDLIVRYDIKVIPFEIVLGDKVFSDGEMTSREIFDAVAKTGTLPKTTALNEYAYAEFFDELKKEYDAVIHIALSSGITSSCGNAERGAKQIENVFVVDSKSLSAGIGLLAITARELADAGKTPREIVSLLEKKRENLQVSFVIETLDYLFKGGRCSSLQLLGANVFKIRPRIVMKDGKMSMDKKYRGSMDGVVGKYCRETLAEFTPDLDRVFITFPSATPEMLAEAYSVCRSAGFKEILEAHAGGTIASHCGPNTLGIFYFTKNI